jgi:hypothetical protein
MYLFLALIMCCGPLGLATTLGAIVVGFLRLPPLRRFARRSAVVLALGLLCFVVSYALEARGFAELAYYAVECDPFCIDVLEPNLHPPENMEALAWRYALPPSARPRCITVACRNIDVNFLIIRDGDTAYAWLYYWLMLTLSLIPPLAVTAGLNRLARRGAGP